MTDTGTGEDWTPPRLTGKQAETLLELLNSLSTEMQAQAEKQGMATEPAKYTTLVRSNYREYLEQRYGVTNPEK